jgi:hypothetical protein
MHQKSQQQIPSITYEVQTRNSSRTAAKAFVGSLVWPAWLVNLKFVDNREYRPDTRTLNTPSPTRTNCYSQITNQIFPFYITVCLTQIMTLRLPDAREVPSFGIRHVSAAIALRSPFLSFQRTKHDGSNLLAASSWAGNHQRAAQRITSSCNMLTIWPRGRLAAWRLQIFHF